MSDFGDFDLNSLVYELPYGPGLWDAIQAWPGEELGQLNTITRMATFNCGQNWDVYLETLFPALGELFLVMIDFSWDDVARGYFRPAGIRTRWKFRPGAKGKKPGRFEIPELGELFGSHLPGAKIFKGIAASGAWKWFWRVDGVLQRGLWYFMVVDIVSDFIYTWGTGIISDGRCWRSDDGWLQCGPGAQSFPATAGWHLLGTPMPKVVGGDLPPNGFPLYVPPGKLAEFAYIVPRVGSIFGHVDTVSFRIVGEGGSVLVPEYSVHKANYANVGLLGYSGLQSAEDSGRWFWPQASCVATKPDTVWLSDVVGFARYYDSVPS